MGKLPGKGSFFISKRMFNFVQGSLFRVESPIYMLFSPIYRENSRYKVVRILPEHFYEGDKGYKDSTTNEQNPH